MTDKDNKKLPKDGVCDDDIVPKYGLVQGTWRECGGSSWTYENADDAENTFSQVTHPSGHYETIQKHKKKKEIHTHLMSGETRNYVAGGKSTHIDGHHDVNNESTYRNETAGDRATVTGKNLMVAYAKEKITIGGHETKIRSASQSIGDISTSDSVRTRTLGDRHSYVEKDYVKMVKKNEIKVVSENVSKMVEGSLDHYVKKKYKIESNDDYGVISGAKIVQTSQADTKHTSQAKYSANSASDMTFTSDTKITLKVGGSTITIESGSITIKSAQIKFEQG